MKRRRRSKWNITPPESPPMTPMVDIVFLLFVFFLVTLEFREAEGKLMAQLPTSG